MSDLDTEFMYVSLSCPPARCNKIRFGHRQAAHRGRMPEDSVCGLCVTALVRYTQEGQVDIWSPVVVVCYSMFSQDGLAVSEPHHTSEEGLLSLNTLNICATAADSSVTLSGDRRR